MRIRIVCALILLLITAGLLTACGWPVRQRDREVVAFSTGNLLRLHVVANSDSEVDQEVKLKVRDRILAETKKIVTVRTREEAQAVLEENRELLVRAAEKELRENGLSYRVHLDIGRYPFPEKSYPFGVLPGGLYYALRLVLGEGAGENWWCVLYPPVCHLTTEEKPPKNPGEEIRFRWKAWETWQEKGEELNGRILEKWVKYFQLAGIPRTANISGDGMD